MNGALSLRPRGVWLVMSLELRQRIRSKRWYIALGVWTLTLAGMGAIVLAAASMVATDVGSVRVTAAAMFSLLAIMVLMAMLVVLPALSAGAINGDRTAGTLATLQATLLSPLEIVLGKLLAGWMTGLAFLALALPSLLPTALLGGISPFYLLRVLAMIAALALCVTAIGLGLSAVTNRQLGSVVLTYVLVAAVTGMLPAVWLSSAAFLQQEKEVTIWTEEYDHRDDVTETGWAPRFCMKQRTTRTVTRLDLSQPLIWGNPVVMLADVSPQLSEASTTEQMADDPPDLLRLLSFGVRYATSPMHPSNFNSCADDTPGAPQDLGEPNSIPRWPLGLLMWVSAGGVAFATAVWRLSVPIKRLGKGTRIA